MTLRLSQAERVESGTSSEEKRPGSQASLFLLHPTLRVCRNQTEKLTTRADQVLQAQYSALEKHLELKEAPGIAGGHSTVTPPFQGTGSGRKQPCEKGTDREVDARAAELSYLLSSTSTRYILLHGGFQPNTTCSYSRPYTACKHDPTEKTFHGACLNPSGSDHLIPRFKVMPPCEYRRNSSLSPLPSF